MFSIRKSMYRQDFEIAGVSMSLYTFQDWAEEPAFLPFVKCSEVPDYQVLFQLVNVLPEVSNEIIHEDECYRIHLDGKGGYLRTFFDAPRDMTPYAVAEYNHERGRIRIDCLKKGAHCVSELHNSFFHIGFESMLIHKRRLCVHAACVDTALGGILFSGPSGIGKSTQAKLWCDYRDATQINGDRPILSKEESGWFAWGAPYAGSSKCHVNKNCPITAMVILRQADKCSLHRLKKSEAFREIWAGLTIYKWDKWFVEEAADLAMELVDTVPIFQYFCTPDEYAVDYLEEELRKECCL